MEDHGAFINTIQVQPTTSGRLTGTRFAAKDNIDVQGHVSSAGNPDWLRTHPPAPEHAEVISTLLESGATLVGKTHTDELMYSLNGENFHYGTPVNPRAPGRIPGGSSSGSAVAVAAGLVDFALGTDTGGSIRIPSSYCGNYGIRPTHGRVSTNGVIPLSPSFCTVGWMAQTANDLLATGQVLLGEPESTLHPYRRCVVAVDAYHLADPAVQGTFLSAIASFESMFEEVRFVQLADEGLDLWMWAFRIRQAREIWQTHGDWLETVQPSFGRGVRERFEWTKTVTEEVERLAFRLQRSAQAQMARLLDGHTVVVMPTAPGPAPPLNWSSDLLDDWRNRALQLTCPAGLGGLPQVTLPLLEAEGFPVGLSLLGAAGDDRRLLQHAEQIERMLA